MQEKSSYLQEQVLEEEEEEEAGHLDRALREAEERPGLATEEVEEVARL